MAHSKQSKRTRATAIVKRLAKEYPDATTALDHVDAYQLLVATILSAQCTDERVNQVTKVLFDRAPDAVRLHAMPVEEVETIIRSTGFYRNKAKSLKGTAKMLVETFDGRVPESMDALLRLPGVARKTANVVLGSAFGKAVGVVVDTHVRRVSGRLGLTEQQNPVKIEADLMDLLPRQEWIVFSHRLVWHGRRICKARKPRCDDCILADLCPSRS
ncbi:MAG: endonuclease III [Deltaproteobacteria bacterium]|nr:endonuclease III [Deltaproteobacteria bacterium]